MGVSTLERVAIAPPEVRPRGSWGRAHQSLRAFLAGVPLQARHVVLCHSDADGLAAGVVLSRALERLARPEVTLLATGKGESAWSEGTLERLASAGPDALFVLDLGSRPKPIFPGVPTLLADHHRSLGVPPRATLISSYKWRPNPATANLVYWLAADLTDVEDLAWIAAVGIIGDLGRHSPLEPLPTAKERYGSRVLQEATVLVNAARRGASGDATPALAALLAAHEPAEIAHGHLPEARELADMREGFNAAVTAAKREPPAFNGRIALIRVRSPYQVHPVLAQIWRGRLRDRIVIVANEGYLPGRVSFSVRTTLDVNLLDFLQAFRHGLDATELGYGHDKATGGSLSTEDWKRLLATMGFRM